MGNSHVCIVNDSQREKLRDLLERRGWQFAEAPYAHWRASGEKTSVVSYRSGKLTIQGAGTDEFVLFTLEPEILRTFGYGYGGDALPEQAGSAPPVTPHGGIDESGKGDFFGPLAVAGVCVDAESAGKLAAAGCRDSKLIKSDREIARIAAAIRETVPGGFNVLVLMPETYNRLYGQIGNLNRLLAWGHARVIENLLTANPGCPRMISDKFGSEHLIRSALMTRGRAVKLEQMVRAESDVAVAAASILARDAFVHGMAKLSEEIGHTLPRGASGAVLAAAREFLAASGAEKLARVVKTHFKCWREVTGL